MKLHAQLVEHEQSFITSIPGLDVCVFMIDSTEHGIYPAYR